ncbi:MAG: DUF2135 domain-containing protein, partial [Fusobacteriaceae bacterium]|nr:DUF2135 domain-containing protein [Fusobacteriaceae bacterium]
DGQYQKALDLMYGILLRDWDRFNEIKEIVFVELNHLIATHPKLDLSKIDQRFIYKMPVDIRIVLAWSSNNTDIDLHMKDPYEEVCFYDNTLTKIGGKITYDFTQGYGPEEIMLKKAIPGNYSIFTNNYGDHRQDLLGPSTLYLDIYTHYGSPDENHQRILVRTAEVKEKNEIGSIDIEQ